MAAVSSAYVKAQMYICSLKTDTNLNICLAYDYDEQPERDTDNLYDIEEDKRAWNSGFNGGIGKRAWNSGFNGGVGKRAWNNFNGG